MGSNEIKFLIFQDTTFECIIGSIGEKLSKFLFLSTGPLNRFATRAVNKRPTAR